MGCSIWLGNICGSINYIVVIISFCWLPWFCVDLDGCRRHSGSVTSIRSSIVFVFVLDFSC